MKLKVIHSSILVCEAKNSKQLNRMFYRIFEFCMSDYPQFKHQLFSTKESIAHRKTVEGDKFQIDDMYLGFCFKSSEIRLFFQTFPESMLSKFELRLKRRLMKENFLYPRSRCIIMVVQSGDTATTAHELAHGFWRTSKVYKKRMMGYVKNLDAAMLEKLYAWFRKNYNYDESVSEDILDEIQAYLSTDGVFEMVDRFKISAMDIDWAVVSKMQKFYYKYRNNVKYQYFEA